MAARRTYDLANWSPGSDRALLTNLLTNQAENHRPQVYVHERWVRVKKRTRSGAVLADTEPVAQRQQ